MKSQPASAPTVSAAGSPPHVLYEEDGGFKAGTILSDAGTSLQVEAASGKRTKVKTSAVMLRFAQPLPGELMTAAQQAAQAIDLDFLWECAPQEEFDFLAFGQDYFGHPPTAVEAASLLLRLHGSPVHFYRKGKGHYRPAPAETLRAALAAIARKAEQARLIESQGESLARGELPAPIAAQAARLLVRPDRNSVEWKALERGCELAGQSPERLLLAVRAFAGPRELHLERFYAEHFSEGIAFAPLDEADLEASASRAIRELPLAEVHTFSIDDSSTTEIDDCLSVEPLASGRLRVGIHIAAPALGIAPGSEFDRIARERMSTLYMPGDKVTMLPPQVVARFSLDEGREVPALSLYAELDEAGTSVLATETRLERIVVGHNLRHDRLDGTVTEGALEHDGHPIEADPLQALHQAKALRVLWRLIRSLSAERDRVRGKPEARHRVDFSFQLEGETVRIVPRRRDAPLDRIVAELMILANSRWGAELARHGIPGVYRSQAAGRVRMSTQPLAHQGLGVSQYLWATSPLRRYVDLVNQRQLLAAVTGGVAPYAANDADLFAVISAFDARYGAYGDFQQRMERYWCLRWVAQQPSTRLAAVTLGEDRVRLADAPLYFRMAGLPELAAGRRIVVDILATDLVELSVSARFVEVVSGSADSPADDSDESIELMA